MITRGLPRAIADNIDRFSGRAWLLPTLVDWWENSSERLFLLSGDPGTGKSMTMAWLAGHGASPEDRVAAAQLARLREAVKAVHFCQASSRNLTPQAFAENVANQLTGSVQGFSDAVAATLADRVQISVSQAVGTVATGGTLTGISIGRIDLGALGDESGFDRAFTLPLKMLYASGRSEPLLLLVDALDEALTYTGAITLPDLLSHLVDLPAQVRILATTRDEPRVLKRFPGIRPFDLIKNAGSGAEDVERYVEARLAGLGGFDAILRRDFARRLATKAAGVFLYASMVLDELLEQEGRPGTLPELAEYPLPDGLSGLYAAFLTRELGRDDERWFDVVEPLLGLIAVAQGHGLTTAQLSAIIGKDIRAALWMSKPFLAGDLPAGPFRPFHKSFADFLLQDVDNPHYHIDAVEMHKRIAEHYESKHRHDWTRCEDYGLRNLAVHLEHGHQSHRLRELIDEAWMHARVERDGYRYNGFLRDVAIAWQQAKAQCLRDPDASAADGALSACMRLALIRASVDALSERYHPALLRRAIEIRLWPLERSLSVISQYRDPAVHADLLVAILASEQDSLPSDTRQRILDEALAASRNIPGDQARRIALSALHAHLRGQQFQDVLRELGSQPIPMAATRDAQDMGSEASREEIESIRRLDMDYDAYLHGRNAVLHEEQRLDDRRVERISLVAHRIHDSAIEDALAITREVGDAATRAVALSALAPRLNACQLEQALVAQPFRDDQAIAEALNSLASGVSEPARPAVVSMAVDAARLVEDDHTRVRLLAVSARWLKGSAKEEVLREALETASRSPLGFAEAMECLSSELFGALREAAEAAANEIEDRYEYHRAAAALALVHEPEAALHHGYNQTSHHEYGLIWQSRHLTSVIPRDTVESLARDIMEIHSEDLKAEGLAALGPWLSGYALANAHDAARHLKDDDLRCEVLAALAPSLTGDDRMVALREIVSWARSGELNWVRLNPLLSIAPLLDDPMLLEVLDLVASVGDAARRSDAYTQLVPCLKRDQSRQLAVAAAQAAARELGLGFAQATALEALARALDDRDDLLRETRQCFVSTLLAAAEQATRSSFFSLCTNDCLFRPPIFSNRTLEPIAMALGEIGLKWTWPDGYR
ncbi:hypothetical protein [Variovorax saccharolyticus]|uniref:hypothetical protein n=1 Tax=Variovorax saccharolyticus TaxID=3053516 RepID=UPI002577562E|nr:hypothetical protein [Variovorax sp. J31P216]MDM0030057.1 hypothetical protein [Variovorax sp. J31P216]